ncbi:MAG: hypothetical protein ABEK59_01265 [Halobacteria archaeon]
MSSVIDVVQGERSLYSSLSEFVPKLSDVFEGCKIVTDKVSYDLDAHEAVDDYFPDDWTELEIISRLRSDGDAREYVLGEVCDDARRLAEQTIIDGVHCVGVFSGFGIHVHQLFKPTASRPSAKMGSTCRKYVSELNLATVDEQPIGDSQRVMRVPDMERVSAGQNTGLWTVPITQAELREITPDELLEFSLGPRDIELSTHNRSKMKLYEDYVAPNRDMSQEKMRDMPDIQEADGMAGMLVEKVCKMPCVYERALGRNPSHPVRIKVGIMFLNAGYDIPEIVEIIRQLNWVDFDAEKTRKNLESLKRGGKGDYSCQSMQFKGLCTRADEKVECPMYGYQGGNTPWK